MKKTKMKTENRITIGDDWQEKKVVWNMEHFMEENTVWKLIMVTSQTSARRSQNG